MRDKRLSAAVAACSVALFPSYIAAQTVSTSLPSLDSSSSDMPATSTAPHDSMAAAMLAAGSDMMAMHHHHGSGQLGQYPATRDASGTAWQPDSATHSGIHSQLGSWTVMVHGEATLVYDNQGGPRGSDKTFVLSHFAVDAQHPLFGGTLTLKTLFSFDPLMGPNGYPLLLQTGETADGVTRLIDRQHPHDLVGELAASYSHPLGSGVSAFIYGGPAGEPALGPPVYLHRAVGNLDPETPIDHHWLDSTHLAFGVVTGGLVAGGWKLEGSGFRGREPDQHRYDIETPSIDSWSVRLTWNPVPDWSLQISRGHLHSVEQLEPEDDQTRTTASASYNRPLANGYWQSVFAWGRMTEQSRLGGPGRTSDAFLLESAFAFGKNAVFARAERVSKDEFFQIGTPGDGVFYTVGKVSAGYQRTLPIPGPLGVDVGGLVSKYDIPRGLAATYGASPTSFMLYTRLRLR